MSEYDQEILSTSDGKEEDNLSPVLKKLINQIIQNEGYVTYLKFVKNISTEGGNYMSLLKEVDIKGTTIHHKKETNLFIKQSLPDSLKGIINNDVIFLKEIFFYSDLAKLFNELQNDFNVPDEEKYNFVKYYYGDENSLIFDNMTKKGFTICNRLDTVPSKVLEMSIKYLAKFHGFSMVLKKYRPDFYNNKIQTMKYTIAYDDIAKNVCLTICKITLDYLKDDIKKQVEMLLPGLIDKYIRYLNENGCKFKCLCHGDYRMNNILVKEMDGKIASVIPIDYQLSYYGSPVLDFIYMIFTSTDQQFRRNNMENLKKIYFESLTKFLQYFNIDVETVYTRQDFENDYKSQLDYGLTASMIFLPFVLASEDDIPEVSLELKTVKVHDCFKTRIREIVEDYIEWGYLDYICD